jgi:phage terminase Nu1 subunit (DNA packaging protein)
MSAVLDRTAGETQPAELDVFGPAPLAIIARLLNITERRVAQLAKEGVIPRASRGKYPVLGAVRGYVTFLQRTHEAPGDQDPDKLEPFRRSAHYRAEAEKLRVMRDRGEVVAREDAEAEMARVAKIVVETLETLPDLLERDTGATPKQVALAERVIDALRVQVADQIRGRPNARARQSA